MLSTILTKQILHTTDNYIKSLNKGGILTVGDMLNFFPKEIEDRTNVLDSFSFVNIKEKNTILVKLVSIESSKTSNGKTIFKAVLEDKNGFLSEGVWFNKSYLVGKLNDFLGKKIILSGKVKYEFGKLTIVSPEIEMDLSKVSGEILPVYSDFNYIPGTWISSKMNNLISYTKYIPETLPESIIKKYNFISKSEAIEKLHFPKTKNDFAIAQERLAYDELFEINYKSISKKIEKQNVSTGKSISIPLNVELVKEIISKLPFGLTNHQKISLFQILKDIEKPHSMQRLLQGDVGTGKTIVATIAIIHSILIYSQQLQTSPQKTSFQTSPQPSPLEEREIKGIQEQLSFQTSPHSPLSLEERGIKDISIRKIELKSPGYVFELAREFRKNQTEAEKRLWNLLKNNKFENIKFRRQHPIGRYIADFYNEELNIIIELDGKIHNEKYQIEYDNERDNLLKNYGLKIFRFKNDDILKNNDEKIFEKLKFHLTNSPLLQRRGVRGEVGSEETRGEAGSEETNFKNHKIQVCFMVPTEILARQHFEGLKDFFLSYSLNTELLVGSSTKKQKEIIKENLKSGNIDIIIGTHALLEDDVIFNKLGLVIIDEQHRFGVKQREILEKYYSKEGIIPHVLNMTATPIPRTLALTLYGDQDLSIINEYPKDRKTIFTKVIKNEPDRQTVELFIRSELEKGRQVFWISPLVEESEKIDLANAINTFTTLTEIFSPFKVGLLHGKLKAKEKEEIMRVFTNNEIQILSSTSVVEVGVDIKNATIMCIEGAERFGLSQLHQFRGRVGRGEFKSYCYLFPSFGKYTDRLKAMEKTNNGFELAEIDLEIRGPGEVYGVRQSGIPEFKIASLKDLEFVSQIREDIEELFKS